MNAENAKNYLPLVQALADGKMLQYKFSLHGRWADTGRIFVSTPASYYRVKPEPREWMASIVTKEVHEHGGFNLEEIGTLVGYDNDDAELGYEIVRVREILD